jgi:hypothetical protein
MRGRDRGRHHHGGDRQTGNGEEPASAHRKVFAATVSAG